jgi:hypothetical protein
MQRQTSNSHVQLASIIRSCLVRTKDDSSCRLCVAPSALQAAADHHAQSTAARLQQLAPAHAPGALPCGTSGQFSLTSLPSSVAHTLMLLVNTKLPDLSHCCVAARTCARAAHADTHALQLQGMCI